MVVPRILRLSALSCAALAVLAGERVPPGPAAATPVVTALDAVRYPLDVFDFSDSEAETTASARYELARRCARGFGFDLPARQPGSGRVSRGDRYGLADHGRAAEWGYSLDAPPSGSRPWEMALDPRSEVYPVVLGVDAGGRPAAIPGLPGGGCRAAANRVLEDGVGMPGRSPIPELERRAWQESRYAPAVRRAIVEWRRCMLEAGFDYAEPVDAPYAYWFRLRVAENPRPSPEQRRDGFRPSDAERRAALADVACKEESSFVKTWSDAEIAAQRVLVTRNVTALRDYRDALVGIVAHAQEVLASRP